MKLLLGEETDERSSQKELAFSSGEEVLRRLLLVRRNSRDV